MDLSPTWYHWLVRPTWFTQRCIHRHLLEHFCFQDQAVLDFGSGVGSNCVLFSSEKYVGMDIDERRVTYATKKYPNYRFIHFHEDKVPFQGQSFDYILMVAVLHHISSDKIAKYLNALTKILKPDGKMIILEPCFMPRYRYRNWFMKIIDRGKFIRDQDGYQSLFESHDYGVQCLRTFQKLGFYNV